MERKKIDSGIKTVALFEAFKGIIVIITGFALLHFIHGDLQAFAENIVRHLHMNPARHYPHILLDAVSKITDSRIRTLALFSFIYSLIRFIEAYGLWNLKAWAEWFAILSGGIYIPMEIAGLIHHITPLKVCIFIINLLIVMYLIYVRVIVRKAAKASE
jgi:uncharacterized membrane protein (DUF2068 family)